MPEYSNFSSLPAHEEQAFVVYERHGQEAMAKGKNLGFIVGGVMLVLSIGMYVGLGRVHPPPAEEPGAKKPAAAAPAKAADKPAAKAEDKPAEAEGDKPADK